MARPKHEVSFALFQPSDIPEGFEAERKTDHPHLKSQYRTIWAEFIRSGQNCVSCTFERSERHGLPRKAKAVYNALYKVCPRTCRVIRRGDEVFLIKIGGDAHG